MIADDHRLAQLEKILKLMVEHGALECSILGITVKRENEPIVARMTPWTADEVAAHTEVSEYGRTHIASTDPKAEEAWANHVANSDATSIYDNPNLYPDGRVPEYTKQDKPE